MQEPRVEAITPTGFQRDNIHFFPIVHQRAEFAAAVARTFDQLRPDCVAIELPRTLASAFTRAIERLPLLSVIRYPEADNRFVHLLIEPADPIVEAARRALDYAIPLEAIDADVEGYPFTVERVPDSTAITRIGYAAYTRELLNAAETARHNRVEVPADTLRERHMAFRLQSLAKKYNRILCVLGAWHLDGVLEALASPQAQPLTPARRTGVAVFHLHPDASREVLAEPGYISSAYESLRARGTLARFDRSALQLDLARAAALAREREDNLDTPPRMLDVLFQFARNQALLEGALTPDLLTLITAARGAADDNLAWHLYHLGTDYPFQTETPDLDILRLRIEDLHDRVRRVRFRRLLQKKRRNILRLLKNRRHAEDARSDDDGDSTHYTCSYPPEDLALEQVSASIQRVATSILTAEHTRVLPFTTSLHDGIDIRETLRNWHESRLYVRSDQPLKGKVGSVVMLFDDEPTDAAARGTERYPHTMTWQGEHEGEGDLACFATDPAKGNIGPGIARCTYGGFLLSYPPGRMMRVWGDEAFASLPLKSEVLIAAAIEYSLERIIVVVAPRPPRARWQAIAARYGHKLVFIPSGQLSPQTLARIRVFHVLAGRFIRSFARDFIYDGPSRSPTRPFRRDTC